MNTFETEMITRRNIKNSEFALIICLLDLRAYQLNSLSTHELKSLIAYQLTNYNHSSAR